MISKGLIPMMVLAVLLLWSSPSFADELAVTVSPNGRYFVQNGKPFFWLGDTIWSLYSYYSKQEAEEYLEHRRQQGFTVAQTMILFNGGPGLSTGATNVEGNEPFLNWDPTTPNEAYFKNIDYVVDVARKKGMILTMVPMGGSGGAFVDKKKIFTKENVRAYGRFLATRYKGYSNLIWTPGFDLPPWRHTDILDEFLAGFQEGDGGAHMLSSVTGGCHSSSYYHQQPWLAYNTIQVWTWYWRVHSMVTADYCRLPIKPVVMSEAAYEDGVTYTLIPPPVTPLIIRKAAYWSYLAGGFTTYGHAGGWRKWTGWRQMMDSPGARQMVILKDIFTGLQWWKLVPDQSVFVFGANNDTALNAAARSSDGDIVIVYLSSQTTVTLDMTKITAGKTVRATWVNPQTGDRKVAGEFENTGQRTFTTPPSSDDGVLLLEAVVKH
jgi:hypothetical protein